MPKISSVSYRTANLEDIGAVVELHQMAFPGFFLTILGQGFLRTMYEIFLNASEGVFVVCTNNHKVVGFAVGVMNTGKSDGELAIRYLPRLFWHAFPKAVANPGLVINRLIKRIFDKGVGTNLPSGSLVLRSIGIESSHRGTGIASQLLSFFEKIASSKGASSVALTTDAFDNERTIAFYIKHGYVQRSQFMQDASRPMYLMSKLLGGLG